MAEMRLQWQLFNLGRLAEAVLLDKMWALLQPLCGHELRAFPVLQVGRAAHAAP